MALTAVRRAIGELEVQLKEEAPLTASSIIDAVPLLGDRAKLLRDLEARWVEERSALASQSEPLWSSLSNLRSAAVAAGPDQGAADALSEMVAALDDRAKTIRAARDAVTTMIDGLAQDVASEDRPLDWVRRALGYSIRPYEFRHEDAVEQRDYVLETQSLIDPDMQPLGQTLAEGDDLRAFFAMHANDDEA